MAAALGCRGGPLTDEHQDLVAIERQVSCILGAWTSGQLAKLEDCFHPDVVFVAPGFEQRVVGREACIASYREFLARSNVTAFESLPPRIDLAGDTAVAVSRWRIAWEAAGERHRDQGHDVLVLTRTAEGWRVVWRFVETEPSQ